MKRLVSWFNILIKKRRELRRWQRIVTVLAAVMTFVTTYALILPAITVERDKTGDVGGMYLEQAADQDAMLEDNALEPTDVSFDVDQENDAAKPDGDGDETTAAPAVGTLKYYGSDYTVILTYDETVQIPTGAALEVSEISAETDEYWLYLEEAKKAMGLSEEEALPRYAARFFDIKIMADDQEFTPDSGVSVEITYEEPLAEIPDTEVNAVHFADETAEGEVIEANASEVQEDGTSTVEFMAESFSVYGVIYTIDFHWEVDGNIYEYSLAGGDSMSFRELVEMLHIVDGDDSESSKEESGEIEAFINDIAEIRFSDESLVKVVQITEGITAGALKDKLQLTCDYSEELTVTERDTMDNKVFYPNDWALISLKAFDTEEYLTVVMKDTEEFQIRVTDAQIKRTVIDAKGDTWEITVTYGTDTEIPEGAALSVDEILPGTSAYDRYLADSAEELGVESGEVSFARFFDVRIVDENDEKIEPKSPVQVKIEYKDGVDTIAPLNIVHFAEDGTEIITDVDVSKDGTEITYLQDSFSVTGTISSLNADNRYAIIITYEGKTYSVDSDGTLTPVELDGNGNIGDTVTINNSMIWRYDGQNVYHESNAVDTDANKVASDYYYKYIDANEDSGLFDEDEHQDTVTTYTQPTYGYMGEYKEAKYVSARNHKGVSAISHVNGHLQNTNGTRYIAVDETDGVLRLKGTDNVGEAASVSFAQVRVNPNGREVDPWKHTVNHIDIAVEGAARVSVPLAYGKYYYVKDGEEYWFDVTENTDAYWIQDVDIDTNDIKSGTLEAYTGYGTDDQEIADQAFYITGYSANAETDNDIAQVRIDGVFKVSMADEFTQSDYGYGGFSETTLTKRLDEKVTYVFTTSNETVEEQQVYWTADDGNQYPLFNMHRDPLTVSGEISISAFFDYWDDGDGTWADDDDPNVNKGNTCPPIRGQRGAVLLQNWQKGAIFNDDNHTFDAFNVSGMDFRLDGHRASSKIDLDAIEITKYIVDKSGNLIRLEDGSALTSTFTIYRNPDGNKHDNALNYDDLRDINPADSVHKGNGSMPADEGTEAFSAVTVSSSEFGGDNLYNGYSAIGDPVTANIGIDGSGLVHNHNVAPGLYYIEEDKNSIPSFVNDSQGNKYAYIKTFIETEYVWRGDEVATSGYNKAVHVSPYYHKSDSGDMVSIPEVLGHYRDADGNSLNPDGSAISNGFLEFFVYNVYEDVVAQIDTTKQWQDEDGEADSWKANVMFKLMKKTVVDDSVTYSDVTKPDYYAENGLDWSQTITVTSDKRQAKWENLNQLGDNESYVIIEEEIIPLSDEDELTDVKRNQASGAITSFKLNDITYYVIDGEISDTGGTTINKAVPETDIVVQKVWESEDGLAPGSATMVLYKKVGTRPSTTIQVTIQADPAPVTTNAGNIHVTYTGTNKDGTAASGSFDLNNSAGWSKSLEFDRGGSYTFAYEPDHNKVITVTPDKTGEINDDTTITLSTETAPIADFTYTFIVPEDERPEKGYIVVTCNGVEKTANADNDWTVDFQVAEGSTVRYDAVGDGKFVTSVLLTSTTSEGSGEIVSKACDIFMKPTISPLKMKVPVSVNWNEAPDAGTEVTVTFVPDKPGVAAEQVTLSNGTWSVQKEIPRLDDSGDLITWTVTSSVSPSGGTAKVSLSEPSDGTISGGGAVVVDGTVTRKMNLTVQVKTDNGNYANIAEFFSLGHTRSVNSYNEIYPNGWINGYTNTTKTISDLAIEDENGNAIYYCFYIYSTNKVSTNAEEAGVGTRYNNYIYVKAQPGDVKILLEKSSNGNWQILTNQNMNTLNAPLHTAYSPRRGLMKSGSGNGRLREVGVIPSTQKTFYDPDLSEARDVPFELIQFKDLPEGAEPVYERDDYETVINGDGTFTWSKLPAEDANGNPIYYYIVEKDATAYADTMSVKYEYAYNDDGSISRVKITNSTHGIPEPTTGNVTVTKTFTGLGGNIPENFQITNDYNEQVFTVSGANGTVAPTGNNPYVWTITDVPDGTEINFTESGIQAGGYNLTVNGTATAAESTTVAATAIKNQVVNANLVNAYELKVTNITLKKVDKKDVNKENPDLLKGATFILSKYTDSTFQSKDESWGTSGSKTLSDTKQPDGTYTLNGEFTFDGLTVGYYQLEEDDFPKGYVKLTSNPTFKVEANAANVLEITLINNPDNLLRLEDNKLTIVVGNTPGAALPHTGGSGMMLYYLMGLMLIAMAGIGIVMKRRLVR